MIPNRDQLVLFRASAVNSGSDDLLWAADQALAGNPDAVALVAVAMNKAMIALVDAKNDAAALRVAA